MPELFNMQPNGREPDWRLVKHVAIEPQRTELLDPDDPEMETRHYPTTDAEADTWVVHGFRIDWNEWDPIGEFPSRAEAEAAAAIFRSKLRGDEHA